MGSTEDELRAMARDLQLPRFLGTFDKSFPGFLQESQRCCAIVNTAARHTGGRHWLAVAWEPASRTFYFFDPFGFSDRELAQVYDFEYQRLLRKSAIQSTPDRCLTLVKSTQSVQGPHSAACGLFCLLFLAAFAHYPDSPMAHNPVMDLVEGVDNTRLFDADAQPIFRANQEACYAFLARHSAYFRAHRHAIMEQTHLHKALDMQ